MVEIKKLAVELRDSVGKRRNRRLRESGLVPAVLYGHQQPNVNLSVPKDEATSVLRHGSRFVMLTGAVNERAFIKTCQWDTWGNEIYHLDFTRVLADEVVRLSIPLELRGEAPGTKEGGVLKQVLHSLEIECQPAYAPEKIAININHLGFNQAITLGEVALPEGVKALGEPNTLVVECMDAVDKVESEESTDGAEPEVIGRKKAEEPEE